MRTPGILRLFVAAYPPADIAAALVESVRTAPVDGAALRVTPAAQAHITMQFIGDTGPRALDGVLESVERSASGLGPAMVRAAALATLPRPRRGRAGDEASGARAGRVEHPRLIAAILDADPPLLELHRRLAHRLATGRRRTRGADFAAHITLARLRPGARAEPFEVAAAGVAAREFVVDRIALVRSELKAEGAVHSPVAWFELGGGLGAETPVAV